MFFIIALLFPFITVSSNPPPPHHQHPPPHHPPPLLLIPLLLLFSSSSSFFYLISLFYLSYLSLSPLSFLSPFSYVYALSSPLSLFLSFSSSLSPFLSPSLLPLSLNLSFSLSYPCSPSLVPAYNRRISQHPTQLPLRICFLFHSHVIRSLHRPFVSTLFRSVPSSSYRRIKPFKLFWLVPSFRCMRKIVRLSDNKNEMPPEETSATSWSVAHKVICSCHVRHTNVETIYKAIQIDCLCFSI